MSICAYKRCVSVYVNNELPDKRLATQYFLIFLYKTEEKHECQYTAALFELYLFLTGRFIYAVCDVYKHSTN